MMVYETQNYLVSGLRYLRLGDRVGLLSKVVMWEGLLI
jgi:hypothetical protein